jgi:hypothetical protein
MDNSRLHLIRVGAVAGIVGSVAGAIGNIVHPSVPDAAVEAAQTIADSAIWVPVHVSIAIALFLMLMGLVAVYEMLNDGPSGAWARYGYVAAIVGLTVGVILMASDGITAKYASEAWVQAPEPEKVAALRVADMAEKVSFALVAMFNIFFAGFPYLFYGLAVARSRGFPQWLGWIAAVAGAGSIAVGVAQAMSGSSSPTIELLTIVLPTVITLWTAIMGVLILRALNRKPN